MKPRQHAHAAAGEEVRRAHGKGRGQFEHGVRAAQKRHARARPLGEHGRLPALGEAAAQTDDQPLAVREMPRFPQMMQMPVVEGIVFGDDAGDGHRPHLHPYCNR